MPTLSNTYCVIGAGPSGLATSRALSKLDIPHVVYEKHSDVGGIWDLDNPGTPLYESAHFISSKWTSGFTGFPMQESLADYPHHSEVLRYLRAFSANFDLYRNVSLRSAVSTIKSEGNSWRVAFADGGTALHRGVICANGVTWLPSMPAWPGQFDGEMRHSSTYRSTSEFAGKRVVIVGLGNSGADIACDAARHASHATISVRRGYHFLPKHVYGWPIDVLLRRPELVPDEVRTMGLRAGIFAVTGDVTRLGFPKPDHAFDQAHPLLNTQILHHLAHGDIQVRPDIARLDGRTVHFQDGRHVETDLILAATGYRVEAPYLDKSLFETRGNRAIQYMNVFNRRHHELFSIGFAEVAAGIYPLIEQMAHLVAHHIDDRMRHPSNAREFESFKQLDTFDTRGGRLFIDSDRHANYVDLPSYIAHTRQLCDRFGWPRFE